MNLSFPLPSETLVLTVNSRLARHLLDIDHQSRQGTANAWPTPPIFSLDSWLQDQWTQTWPERYPLNSWQRELLWEGILGTDSQLMALDPLSLEGLAQQAAEAYRLFHEYQLPLDETQFSKTDEARIFFKWKSVVEAAMKSQHLMDSSELYGALGNKIREKKIAVPQKVILAGFDEVSPSLETLIQRFNQAGTEVSFYPRHPGSPLPSWELLKKDRHLELRPLDNQNQEVVQCARWIRSIYKKGNRIGIVVFGMPEYRELLKRELMAELAPASVFCWNPQELPFNLSLGSPLSAEPMIRAALAVLTASASPLPLSVFQEVIRSPYLNAGEFGENLEALLEYSLNRKKILSVDLEVAFRLVQTPKNVKKRESRQFRPLRNLIESWNRYLSPGKSKKRKLSSEWAREFSKTLSAMGWPQNHRALQTRERQAYVEWEKRLDDFASLDPFLGPVSRLDAALCVKRIASSSDQPFQEKTREDTPIQVLGALEAAGQTFDHLWVLGCHSEALPEIPRPNPLIPIQLQKERNLPHASADRELEFARKLVARLMESAPHVVFSYPQWRGEEPLVPSPLLSRLPVNENRLVASNRIKDHMEEVQPETIEDRSPENTTPGELDKVQGGFRIFKNQAECPFRSFATHRLMADRIDPPELDYENTDRGNLVHKVMELFWDQVKSRDALQQIADANDLESRARAITQLAMNREEFSAKWVRQPRFRQIEEDRITKLVHEWGLAELERSDFMVLAQEKKEHLNFGGLKLQLKIDRIDRIENNKVLLIDYKTGIVKTANWYKPPLRDPQLPLYACHLKPDGIAFAQVKKGAPKIEAAHDPAYRLKGIHFKKYDKETECSSWKELLDHWTKQLEALATDFKNGHAEIRPLDGESTCRYCNLGSLCRIEELQNRQPPGETP